MSNTIRVGSQFDTEDEVAATATVMDDLRASLAESVEVEVLETVVPARSRIMMMFRANIDYDELKLWTKRAKESRQKDAAVDTKKLSTIILANTCVGMKYNVGTEEAPQWREMFGSRDGKPMTFSHPETQEMLGATIGGVYQTIEKMYGYDGHIILVAQTISAKAGYTDLDFDSGESDPLVN